MSSFYDEHELEQFHFKKLGKNVLISRKASLYGTEKMIFGNHVRIDDFCIISGKVDISNHVHIAAYSAIFAGDIGVQLSDYAGLSTRITIYAESDDYSGTSMTNPTIPDKYKSTAKGKVEIGRHAIIGAGSIILPGVAIEEGTSIGSMSLVNKDTEPWGIYVGVPIRKIKDRKKDLLELEKAFIKECNDTL